MRPDVQLKDKTAIVTGGARGIGRAIAEALAADGARIVVADLQGADAAAKELGSDKAIGVTCDVSDEAAVAEMVKAARQAFGGCDILVNNAGIYSSLVPGPFENIAVADWQRVMDANILGTFLCCRAVVPLMRQQGGGRIININSGTPFKGVPYLLHYVASKGAVLAMTRALARELGGDNILVNGVAPGFTLSDGVQANPVQMEKLREVSAKARSLVRDQHPADIVGAVCFFAGPGAAFITGQTLIVDGGAYFS
jgi:NAD(P)-dependent dehydrogenase (short-subunit alcohol dehydrogenase family)